MTASKILVANWKMFGSLISNMQFVHTIRPILNKKNNTKVVICPPFPYLAQLQTLLENTPILLGAQNFCSYPLEGAYTGEVSDKMLKEFDCQYVIIGHSERRTEYGETDALVSQKCETALNAGLIPIVCIGETLAERESHQTIAIIQRQLHSILASNKNRQTLIIAYEPRWAIGATRSATPLQIKEIHQFIQKELATFEMTFPVIYGGSVSAANVVELCALEEIDGLLVGRASLVANEFEIIYKALNVSH